jgi:phage baseplate assembly protein W
MQQLQLLCNSIFHLMFSVQLILQTEGGAGGAKFSQFGADLSRYVHACIQFACCSVLA